MLLPTLKAALVLTTSSVSNKIPALALLSIVDPLANVISPPVTVKLPPIVTLSLISIVIVDPPLDACIMLLPTLKAALVLTTSSVSNKIPALALLSIVDPLANVIFPPMTVTFSLIVTAEFVVPITIGTEVFVPILIPYVVF